MKPIIFSFGKYRVALVPDFNGSAARYPGGVQFGTNLSADYYHNGKWQGTKDLGSGTVTNVGVTAMANDFNWAAPSGAAMNILKLANWHASGTGITTNAATDIRMETPAAPTATLAQVGVQSLVSAAMLQKYRSVATLNYTSTLAITEWGLLNDTTLSATTGSPLTAATATVATATATPFTASSSIIRGQQQNIIVPATTTVYGLVLSNTTAALTIPAWYVVATGAAGATPGATEAYVLRPVLWDRKTFAAINVVSGDSIQFTYDLEIVEGG